MAGRFSVSTVFSAVDKVTPVLRKITTAAQSATKSVGKITKEMDGHLDSVNSKLRTAATLAGAAGLAVGGGLLWAGKAGADFEQAITKVGAVSLMSRDQIADLEKEAMRLGATTKFTATEAANAMEVMGRAGFKNSEILSGIGGILNAAAAEGADMAEVTSHVSNVLKGMGLEAGQAGRVADVLALASARTNSSISSLGESMKNLSPVARQFGVSLEDSVAMVALLQDVGLDASEAGTATATMMTKLAKPSKEVAAQMKAMGVAFKDDHGNALPMVKIFEQMTTASGKLGGNMDKVAFFSELVGLRGQKAALNLQDLFKQVRFGADGTKTLSQELTGAKGSAEKMATLSMANLLGDLTLMESAIDGVKVALYNTESVGLRSVIQGMTDWIGKNQELIVSGFTEFMTGLRDNLPKIVTWLERVGKIVTVWIAFSLAVKAVNTAMVVLNVLLAANPITLWIYAIVAALALLWAFWPEISGFFSKLWDTISGVASAIGGAVMTALSAVWQAIKPFVMGVIKYVVGLAVILAQPFIILVKGLVLLFTAWFGFLKGLFWKIVEFVTPVVQAIVGLWTWWIGLVIEKISTFVSAFAELVAPIVAIWAAVWEGVKMAFSAVFDWISEKIGWLVGKAGWIVDKIAGIGGDALNGKVDYTEGVRGNAGADLFAPRTSGAGGEGRTDKTEVTVKAAPGTTATRTGKKVPGLNFKPTGGM